MKRQAFDDELRSGFLRLREQDEERASPFEHAWSVAAARATARPPRWGSFWLAPAAVALLAAVVLLARFAPDTRPFTESPPAAATQASLSQWRAPSDVLLVTSGNELWRGIPRLGAPEVGWTQLPTEES